MPSTNEFDLSLPASASIPAPPVRLPVLAPSPQTPPFIMKPPPVRLAAPVRVLVAALLTGGMGCALFYSQDIGLNVLLFLVLLFAALSSLADREAVLTKWRNVFLTVPPLFFFALMTSLRASGLLTFWNVFACAVLLLLTAHFWAAGEPTQTGFWGFVGGLITTWGNCIGRVVPTTMQAIENARQTAPTQHHAALPVVRGALLALPILAVFIALLASADLVFARMVQNVGAWLLPADIGDAMGRLFTAVVLAWGAAGGLAYALTRRDKEPVLDSFGNVSVPAPLPTPLGFVEAIMVLGSVCSVFAAFVAIQFAYLFGGASHVAAVPGMNFATYARRGFWELVAVACLTLVLVSTLRTFTRRDTMGHTRVFNMGGTTLVALTLVLLASAGKRMGLFEAAYGFTELRLYVDVFLFWLAAALVFFVWTLWTNSKTFAFGDLVCACGMLVTLNLIGPDATVVNRNFARQALLTHDPEWEGFYRFPNASPDAVPALLAKWKSMSGGTNARQRKLLGASLRLCLTNLEKERKASAWPSWNWSRAQAYHLLNANDAILPTEKEANDFMGSDYFHRD